jgi:small subunit ribosomal protein S14
MVSSNKRDKKLRKKYLVRESLYRECKSLYQNRFLSPQLRELAREHLVRLGCSPVKIVNRCVVTGRSGGVMRDFKVSRLEFKRGVAKGHYLGVKKGSW